MKKKIEELKEKIISEARTEAGEIISRAKKARDRIIERAEKEGGEIVEKAEKEGREILEKEKEKLSSEKVIDERKKMLSLRQELFNRLKEDLVNEMTELLEQGGLDMWLGRVINEVLEKEEKLKLIVPESPDDVFLDIEKRYDSVKLKKEAISSGFLLRTKNNEYDFRFRTLAENIVENNKKMIAEKMGVTVG